MPRVDATNLLDAAMVAAVKGFEGFTQVATWDYQQWTNGYGTKAHYPHEVITEAEAERRLSIELDAAQGSIMHFQPTMPQGVKNALIDLTFNTGTAWMHSGLGEEVKLQNWDEAKVHLLQYDKAGGKVLKALQERRDAEASWFPKNGDLIA
jgi:lysozyme